MGHRAYRVGKKEWAIALEADESAEEPPLAKWADGTSHAVAELLSSDLALMAASRGKPSTKIALGKVDDKPLNIAFKKDRHPLCLLELDKKQVCSVRLDKVESRDAAVAIMKACGESLMKGTVKVDGLYPLRDSMMANPVKPTTAMKRPASCALPAAASAAAPPKGEVALKKKNKLTTGASAAGPQGEVAPMRRPAAASSPAVPKTGEPMKNRVADSSAAASAPGASQSFAELGGPGLSLLEQAAALI
jgi:hypothetical protein